MALIKKAKVLLGLSTLLGTVVSGPGQLITAQAVGQQSGSETVINKDNFEDYFTLANHVDSTHPTAQLPRYDKNTGILTLTPNLQDQSGSATLNDRVSLKDDFSLKGSIYLGDKLDSAWNERHDPNNLYDTSPQFMGGGDGIAFGFHPGEIGTIGYSGANMGIGGLKNAFGYKFDTFYNLPTPGDPNGKDENHRLGWQGDPTSLNDPSRPNLGIPTWPTGGWPGTPFGTFVQTNGDNGFMTRVNGTLNDLDPSLILNSSVARNTGSDGWDAEVDPQKGFVPVEFNYHADSHKVVVIYNGGVNNRAAGGFTNEMDVSDQFAISESFALALSAGTGLFFNLQQFKIDSFRYTGAKEMTIQKEWLDDDPAQRPDQIEAQIIQVTQSGQEHLFAQVTISAANNWQTSITNLPEFDAHGEELNYIVREVPVPGYQATIATPEYDPATKTYQVLISNRVDLTPEQTAIKINKLWKDDAATDRPKEIFVELRQNDQLLEILKLTAPTDDPTSNQWQLEVSGLDALDENGKPYEYTLVEQAVDGYQMSLKQVETEFTITNRLEDNGGTPDPDEPAEGGEVPGQPDQGNGGGAPSDQGTVKQPLANVDAQASEVKREGSLPNLGVQAAWGLAIAGMVGVAIGVYQLWRRNNH